MRGCRPATTACATAYRGDAPQNSLPALVPILVIQHTMAPLQHGQLGSAVAGLDCSLGAACTERAAACGPD
ncbi:hypothetical protein RSc3433 [Ralstonia pseudosolanacearum GMI1000]|uniref:Uncharacterized protein n=1 Tax=Ralstonia nicotianae (strain ATCC BAA-1114 / GMI1000) TaxID=267608 RepID=Q8XTW3_RALN1|nr:hypothetical protein RSc3433 [Ralstonia pseudosolanacearum GMI1000]